MDQLGPIEESDVEPSSSISSDTDCESGTDEPNQHRFEVNSAQEECFESIPDRTDPELIPSLDDLAQSEYNSVSSDSNIQSSSAEEEPEDQLLKTQNEGAARPYPRLRRFRQDLERSKPQFNFPDLESDEEILEDNFSDSDSSFDLKYSAAEKQSKQFHRFREIYALMEDELLERTLPSWNTTDSVDKILKEAILNVGGKPLIRRLKKPGQSFDEMFMDALSVFLEGPDSLL